MSPFYLALPERRSHRFNPAFSAAPWVPKNVCLESVAAQEALNLTLFVEHGDPVLPDDDWQLELQRQVGTRHQVAHRDSICLN